VSPTKRSLFWLFRWQLSNRLLVALVIIGDGNLIAGVMVIICAYAGSLFITERAALR
jgi:hypothetical protein